MPPRLILRADDAPNDGVRRLRELLRSSTLSRIARKLACDASAVRRWARGERTPTADSRVAMAKELGIPIDAWEQPAQHEPPPTEPRRGHHARHVRLA